MVSIRSINTSEQEILIATINQPAREALQLLLADGTPTVGLGKTFWRVSRFFSQSPPVLGNEKSKN